MQLTPREFVKYTQAFLKKKGQPTCTLRPAAAATQALANAGDVNNLAFLTRMMASVQPRTRNPLRMMYNWFWRSLIERTAMEGFFWPLPIVARDIDMCDLHHMCLIWGSGGNDGLGLVGSTGWGGVAGSAAGGDKH